MVENALAFRHEFYESAERKQITDDVVSYLGEYRFEVSEFSYTLGIINGKLTDPNTNESMSKKAQKAIQNRSKDGLRTAREEAELLGIESLEQDLKEKPLGTAIWFSPPGPKDEGYGNYGFAYVGKKRGNSLEMTAIRLENPKINDFNRAKKALLGGEDFKKAEDFLGFAKAIEVDTEKVKEFIYGTFEIKDKKSNNVFKKAIQGLQGIIDGYAEIIKNGSVEQKQKAFYTIENLAIEFKNRFTSLETENVIFLADRNSYNLQALMSMKKYTSKPPQVFGSCGVSGRIESNDIFKNINGFSYDNISSSNKEWFNCPKCSFKADGPIGNTCPGCGLTKDQYAQESGEVCE